ARSWAELNLRAIDYNQHSSARTPWVKAIPELYDARRHDFALSRTMPGRTARRVSTPRAAEIGLSLTINGRIVRAMMTRAHIAVLPFSLPLGGLLLLIGL
ncbi:MAG: hypothetical protein AAFP68_10655, partial [Pseudomonadota bacterium]